MTKDPIGTEMKRSLEFFVEAIEAHESLDMVGEYRKSDGSGDTILVVGDSRVAEEVEGHQVIIDLEEIFSAIKDEKTAVRFVEVVAGDANPIVLNGITRIVGYYSRVNNWNKSKIGELRDRRQKNYALSGKAPEHDDERLAVIDSH